MSVLELPKRVAPGDEIEVQLAPLGEWPVRVKGKDGKRESIKQLFDAASCAAVVGNFSRELLVDLDHASVIGGNTRAYAWVTALRADEELGLVGTFRFTEAGAEAVNSKEYRYVSVFWFLDKENRPTLLDSVALTNRPNLPVRPVLNREGAVVENDLENKPERKPNMDKLKELLGLPADADEEAVANAVAALKARLDELDAAAANAEAETFAAANAELVQDQAALKDAYLSNKELAKAMVANFKRPAAPPTPVCDPATARKPALNSKPLPERMAGLTPAQACDALLKD